MGLDLYFDAYEVLSKGAKLEVNVHKWDNQLDEDESEDIVYDTDYSFKVPGMENYANADMFTPNSAFGAPKISVRANKWGRSYKPITNWFKENDIKWKEI